MEIEIRKAGLKDHKHIQKLCREIFIKEKKDFDRTLETNWPFMKDGIDYYTKTFSDPNKCAFIAFSGKSAVGYISGEIMKKISYRKPMKMAEIDVMIITGRFRGKGIGKKLVDTFFEWCKKKGAERLKVEAYARNSEGIRFYRKNGFSDYTLTMEKEF